MSFTLTSQPLLIRPKLEGFNGLIQHQVVPLRTHPSTSMSAFDGVHGTVCNEQQYQQSLVTDPHPTITCLTHGQSIGLTVSVLSVARLNGLD